MKFCLNNRSNINFLQNSVTFLSLGFIIDMVSEPWFYPVHGWNIGRIPSFWYNRTIFCSIRSIGIAHYTQVKTLSSLIWYVCWGYVLVAGIPTQRKLQVMQIKLKSYLWPPVLYTITNKIESFWKKRKRNLQIDKLNKIQNKI